MRNVVKLFFMDPLYSACPSIDRLDGTARWAKTAAAKVKQQTAAAAAVIMFLMFLLPLLVDCRLTDYHASYHRTGHPTRTIIRGDVYEAPSTTADRTVYILLSLVCA